jgi:hypothetical protein
VTAFREHASFDVVHGKRSWPWVSFTSDRVAYASATHIHTRGVDGDGPRDSFALPPDVPLAMFALSSDGVAIASTEVLVVHDQRVRLDALFGEGATLSALAFDRTGKRLWLSAETPTETVIALVDSASLEVIGVLRSAALPRPSLHEIHIHPVDDAALVLAACGEEGTFARVVGFAGDQVSAVPGALDEGGIAAGFVGFSADGHRVHLVEADELRTHAWPTLHELSSVPLADDFVSSFSGAVLGNDIFVDGEYADTQEDAVMQFDVAAIHGVVLPGAAPTGMWAGRLGANAIVTIEPKGDPARGRILVRVASGRAAPGVS